MVLMRSTGKINGETTTAAGYAEILPMIGQWIALAG
jgi:hypothetical protein